LEKIEPYGPICLGINVDALSNAVRQDLSELAANQQTGESLSLSPPTIQVVC
jgi:hypothetical protein